VVKVVEEPIKEEESKKNKKDKKKEELEDGVVFKVQIATSSVKTDLKPENFKGVEGVGLYEAGGLYRYTVGNEKSMDEANILQLQLRGKGFEDAFIVAFKDGKRIPISEAIKLQQN
jgi:N-acetylmuramoyl-L-alanine amidase